MHCINADPHREETSEARNLETISGMVDQSLLLPQGFSLRIKTIGKIWSTLARETYDMSKPIFSLLARRGKLLQLLP